MVQEKAKRQGLDFADAEGAFKKVYEEIEEFKEELRKSGNAGKDENKNKITEEYGDILFSLVNLGRLLDIHPCPALNKSTDKFIKRFGYMEEKAAKPLSQLDAESLDELWESSKKGS